MVRSGTRSPTASARLGSARAGGLRATTSAACASAPAAGLARDLSRRADPGRRAARIDDRDPGLAASAGARLDAG